MIHRTEVPGRQESGEGNGCQVLELRAQGETVLVSPGASVLENDRGTAPGLMIESEGKAIFLFPGVPYELEGLVEGGAVAAGPFGESTLPSRKLLRCAGKFQRR